MHLDDRVLGLLDAEKPYIEIIDGRGREKNASPEWPHSRAQIAFGQILTDFAGRVGGDVGSALRFATMDLSGEPVSLLPDVSYYSEEQLEAGGDAEKRYPRRPPYAAVEIRSSDDRPSEREQKIELHLLLGSRVVIDIDPKRETLTAIDSEGRRTFSKNDIFEHVALPGLHVDLERFFARVNR